MNRSVLAIGLALSLAAAGTTAVGPVAAAVAPAAFVGAGVAGSLAAVGAAHLLVADESSDCMATAAPEPVAVRSDRILVRTPEKSDELIASLVAGAAQADLGWRIAPTVLVRFGRLDAVGSAPLALMNLGDFATDASQVVGLVRSLRAAGLEASPDYGLAPSGGPLGMWPYGPPEPTLAPEPTPRRSRIGTGVTVALYDTGVPIDRYGAHAPANLVLDESDIDKPDHNSDGIADLPFSGHTLAVASVMATLAPGAAVVALSILDDGGVPTDFSTAVAMVASFESRFSADYWPDIIVLPFGTPACDGLPPLAMESVVQQLVTDGRSQLVASAGNRGSERPFYPAAFDGVLAVGSLDLTADRDGSAWTSPTRAGPRSSFSSYGPWVDAWAGGEHLVTRHVAGLSFYAGGPVLDGVAEVSGTSFAAPAVAALLAEGVARTGRPASWVWTHLLRPSGTACPASGGGVAVALTEMHESFAERAERVRRSPC